MGSGKALYWTAVSVLALFVGNHFALRHEGDVHCLASRSLAAVQQVAGNATRFMATAETMLGRGGIGFAQTQTTLACAQTRLASVQTVIARHEAALARVQAEHARIAAMQQLRDTVVCPRERLRMAIPLPSRDGTI
jgi:hypothetical protein